MTLFGLMGGTAMAALLGGWLHTILYGVAVHDAATIAIVAVLISVVAGVATYLPARRAAGIEPTAALRDW
jgi:putative ABC transport system permease protein